jgi:hypothetical protein
LEIVLKLSVDLEEPKVNLLQDLQQVSKQSVLFGYE